MGLLDVSVSPRFLFSRGQWLDYFGCPKFLCLFPLFSLLCHASVFSPTRLRFFQTIFCSWQTMNHHMHIASLYRVCLLLSLDSGNVPPLNNIGLLTREQSQ